ncbi:MAG TPA: hypothetical protein VF006_11090 [Longimicrobium sp.]
MDWKPYDPAWLVEWARANRCDPPWLPDALARCTRALDGGPAYVYFVDPSDANKPGAEWQRESSLMLHHPARGTLVVDVLTDRRVGGIEFLAKL